MVSTFDGTFQWIFQTLLLPMSNAQIFTATHRHLLRVLITKSVVNKVFPICEASVTSVLIRILLGCYIFVKNVWHLVFLIAWLLRWICGREKQLPKR